MNQFPGPSFSLTRLWNINRSFSNTIWASLLELAVEFHLALWMTNIEII